MLNETRPIARFAVWLTAICCFCAGPVTAQSNLTGEPPQVVAVRVVTELGAVLEQNPLKLAIQPGQPFSIEQEGASLRQLYRSGQYADLRAELADVPGGVRLDFVVRQNFFINRVQIAGLREPPSEAQALSALRLGVGEIFQESEMKDAVERLHQTLQDDGFYQATIAYETNPHPETLQMDILVRVTPGQRARIGAITIQNQTQFSDADLRSRLKIKQKSEITSDRLNRAAERERQWLADKNYLGARATIVRGPYDAGANRVPVEFTLYAGLEVRVAVDGAKIPGRTLHRLVPIYQEGAVDEDLLQEGRRALREYFERDGYFDAQVSYTTSDSAAETSGNVKRRAARIVTYHVNQGDKHRVVGVSFSGNKYFSAGLLAGRVKIHPAAYDSPGRYSSSLLNDDLASLRTLYDANGFHDAQVQSHLTDDYRGHHGDLVVQFEVMEGLQTRVAEVNIEGNQQLSMDELLGVIGSSAGQPYSQFNISSDRDNILALYYDQGFSDARFSAEVEQVTATGADTAPRMKLIYHITEGPQVRVARVFLSGYEHTRPGTISREVGIRPGEPLSQGAVVETQRRLYNLGIFSRVSVAPQNAEGEGTEKNVVVLVDEAKRYTVAYGLGLEAQRLGSGAAGTAINVAPRITLELTKANLTGRADSISFKARASTIQGRGLITYTAPNYFASPKFSLQFSARYETARNIQTFDSRIAEGTARLVQSLSPSSSILYRYSFRHVVASNVQLANTQLIPLFLQNTEVSEFGVSWLRDRRNSPTDASRGNFENVEVSMAMKPLGSSANFIHVFLQNSTYHPIGHRLVFARSTRFGMQTPYGSSVSGDIPLPERFFAGGGTSLRGFALNQAGPRDPATGFPIGGQALLVFNQDLRFPMHLPLLGDSLGGAIFYDAGNVFTNIRNITLRSSPPVPTIGTVTIGTVTSTVCLTNCTNELNYFSHTVGFEFRYSTPIGPVALDLGYQLNPAQFVFPTTVNGVAGLGLSRLPSFQFFINLGTTF